MQSAVDRWEDGRIPPPEELTFCVTGRPHSLRHRMGAFLEGWIEDVPPQWRNALNGLSPAFDEMDPELTVDAGITISPGRKGSAPPGAPRGSHIFRALDGLPPDRVRAIIIGQDPYPSVGRATGRAFGQGNLNCWTSNFPRPAASLRRIVQQLAVYRTGDPSYGERRGGWARLRNDIAELDLPPPREVFDLWSERGVLLLNTALTLTCYRRGGHPHQTRGHIPLWAPTVRGICQHLAKREDIPVVFLSWGKSAREFLYSAGILDTCCRPLRVTSDVPRTAIVDRDHPSTPAYLDGRNVFEETNERLACMMRHCYREERKFC